MSETTEKFWAALRGEALRAGVTEPELRTIIGPLARTDALDAGQKHPGGVLLLLGLAGEGKTVAALRWLMAPLLDLSGWDCDGGTWWPTRHRRIVFRDAKSLSRVRQYDQADVDQLVLADRLVLDDLGQEYLDKSGFLASLVDEVITQRHRRALPSVLTANMTPQEFLERYGTRIVDRIAGSGRVVSSTAGSLRRRVKTPTMAPLFSSAAIQARADVCTARRERQRLDDLAAAGLTPAPVPESIHGSREPLTPDQEEARKLEVARRLDEWSRRNGSAA